MAGNMDWMPRPEKVCDSCGLPSDSIDPNTGECMDCKLDNENLQSEE